VSPAPDPIATRLDAPHEVAAADVERYRENGFLQLRGVLPAGLIARYRPAIADLVGELRRELPPLEQRSTYGKAFLQITNLWRRSSLVEELVRGRRLASIAAQLMGCEGARLYHDQALFKEPGGGITPWHADQYYWPLASDRTLTAWIPLVDVPLEMGPLAFCPRSHRLAEGRDLAIGDESEEKLQDRLAGLGCVEEPFASGDVSFHSGWTFHRAGPNRTERMREVFTIIFMDADMRLAAPKNPNQELDRTVFCPDVAVGEVVATPLNPRLYP
jgi:ectoine hydroxylase-related dioxygenase (phytanoyl-CoA dioxygenase family)